MPSIQFSTPMTNKTSKTSIYTRPAKKQKMSITQTYFLAHSARGKLSKEASRPDHDLRLLVGHANMLDHLMIDLANAEQEQERWYNKTISGARQVSEEVHAEESIMEEPEADWEAEDADNSDDDSVYDDDEEKEDSSTIINTMELDSDLEDDDETDSELALTRTSSRHSPPELSSDSDSESEDDHMPLSPPQPTMDTVLSDKQRQAIATTSFYDSKEPSLSHSEQQAFVEEGFFLPTREQPTLIAAY